MSQDSASSPAFQQASASNHGPWVIVTSYISLSCTVLVIVARLVPRIRLRNISLNDCLAVLSTILATVQTVCLTLACNHGLGKRRDTLSDTAFETFNKYLYTSNILLTASIACAKFSVILLVLSIKPTYGTTVACYAVLAFCGLWAISSIFALAFQCSLTRVWDSTPDRCVHQYALQLAVGIMNVISDLAIIVLPYFLMRSVQVSEKKRWTVIGMFGFRIVVPVATVLNLIYLHPFFYSTPPDPTWDAIKPAVWAQIMLNLSIMTSTLPILNHFFADLRTGMMGFGVAEPLELSGSPNKTYGIHTYDSRSGGSGVGGLGLKTASKIGVRSQQVSQNNTPTNLSQNRDDDDLEDRKYGYAPLSTATMTTEASHRTPCRVDRSDSIKGRKDRENLIVQTVDYKVEVEFDGVDGSVTGQRTPQSRHSVSGGDGVDKLMAHEP